MAFLIRKLLFGLIYALGVDVINNPHKYKKPAQKTAGVIKQAGIKVTVVAVILAIIALFAQLFFVAVIIVAGATIIGAILRWKEKRDGKPIAND